MQRTLFIIPHEIAGLPVVGFGWLLIVLAVALLIRLGYGYRQGQSPWRILQNESPLWGMVAVAVAFVLPIIELTNAAGEPVGIAVRWYGLMLLSGFVAAVLLAAYRAQRRGIDPDIIFTLAPWALVGGLVGARLFFVIQYRDQFIAETWSQTLLNMVRFTEGGMVVYGSFIGGFIALSYYVIKHRLPWFELGDVIVPALFIGVALGRIGCLMNGCCYGGRCEEENWYALEFPRNSPVYIEQIRSGDLLGLEFNPLTRRITEVSANSPAADVGIEPDQKLDFITFDRSSFENAAAELPREDVPLGVIASVEGRRYRWAADELPLRAEPVYAVQLLSSVSMLVLCTALCLIPVNFFRSGVVMMLGFMGYAVIRFGLEGARVDEAGQFGTEFSISQWVSFFVFTLAAGGLIWLYRTRSAPQPSS